MSSFDALADPTRRRLLRQLARAPQTAGALALAEPASRPAISRHLRVLREARLVSVTSTGRTRVYALRREGLEPVRRLLEELQPPAPPVAAEHLDALDLEVRRTVREQHTRDQEETA